MGMKREILILWASISKRFRV